MEGSGIFKKVLDNFSHLPAKMLLIGYAVYWVELYVLKNNSGHTTLLAPVIFFCVFIYYCARFFRQAASLGKNSVHKGEASGPFSRAFVVISTLFIILILIIGLYASLLPPHLPQESDAINYHITIPRQHLIYGTFAHLKWSAPDLYLLPVDYALSPYWLSTELPNKFPQFLFFLGLISMAASIVGRYTKYNLKKMFIVIIAIVGSHNVGIQMGTAMLDISLCYLLLAAIDSFQKGDITLSAIEACFYFWGKPFIPLQMLLIIVLMMIIYLVLKFFRFRSLFTDTKNFNNLKPKIKKFMIFFMVFSVFIGGPFIIKSLVYSGTPLFPFAPGLFDFHNIEHSSVYWRSLKASCKMALGVRDQYGSARGPVEFLKHLWLISVPEKGVNNRYDYPIGLMYLLFLGPFLTEVFRSLKKREFEVMPFFIFTFWLTWWMGSHQSRFLFVPIILMFIYTAVKFQFKSRIFFAGAAIALLLVCLSVCRANKNDFGRTRFDVLRSEDKKLVEMSKTVDRNGPVVLGFHDVAYADFKVDVKAKGSIFIINY